MKRVIIYGLSFFLMTIGFYHATIYALPHYVYSKFQKKSQAQRVTKSNEFSLIMAPDENSKLVVKPNPDFAYASAFFDLSNGPIKMTGQMPDSTYWSVAMYEPNTTNFYVKNDLQFGTNSLDLTLGHQDSASNVDVLSDVNKGFILIRLLIKERNQDIQNKMVAYLQTLKIETL